MTVGVSTPTRSRLSTVFSFPDPVNETAARVVAAGVVALAAATVITANPWLLVVLVAGFAARVATGPTLSPLGQLSMRVITPWIERRFNVQSKQVPGPPKRFAQAIGLVFSGGAALATVFGASVVAVVLLLMLTVAASLEALFGLCLGCRVYQAIWGCDECADLSDRLRALATNSST
ncbi:MAG: DUF4395 domain-containing protein [Actinomycetota bacterium]